MLIAQQKRHENIAEYLLYMWQVEDLIRACQLDDALIEQHLVERFRTIEGVTEEQLAAIGRWYQELRDMMLQEGKREQGHLQVNENILIDLTDLHLRLLKDGEDAIYTAAFYQTLPYIVELRSKEGGDKAGELETCFNALYGLMMLRLQKREISAETQAAMTQVSRLVALLAAKYKEEKEEEQRENEG